MLIDCRCGTVNRLPVGKDMGKARARCGKCKHVFAVHELVRARHEAPPPQPDPLAGLAALFGGEDTTDFDTTGLDLDTATDEDLIDILLNGRGRASDGWSPFDNGLPLGPVREELVKEVIPKLRRKCHPKIQHPSRGAAETQLHDVLVHKMAKDVGRIHTYLCPDCGSWHVGHSTLLKRV